MMRYYFLLVGAAALDLAILPWLFGLSWLPQTVFMVLPFLFLRLERRDLYIVFAALLIYLRAASEFNAGILFVALLAFVFFEKWFLVNFFHRDAWQTLALSGLGVAVFYAVLGGLSGILTPDVFFLDGALAVSVLLSTVGGSGVNFLAKKFSS